MGFLPTNIHHPQAPPLKSQGIKTRLVPFIAANLRWDGGGRWVEPFMGSAVVALNLRPARALLADSNPHLVAFYQAIQRGSLTPERVRAHLEREGALLQRSDGAHYYEVRRRFNQTHAPLDMLFLSRSCFNGMMRFNRKGGFNVPFCRKPQRFRPGYITRICNQVRWVGQVLSAVDWTFVTQDWRATLRQVDGPDFVYMDPPYLGRFADYHQVWSEEQADALAAAAGRLPCGFALSMWAQNRYRQNAHLQARWGWTHLATTEHFYHLGATESLRNAVTEALAIAPGFGVVAP